MGFVGLCVAVGWLEGRCGKRNCVSCDRIVSLQKIIYFWWGDILWSLRYRYRI